MRPPRNARSSGRWSMYPTLHDEVSQLLEENDLYFDFHNDDDAEACIKEKDTNIMGRFVCRNNRCQSNGWSSKKIAITIRMYPEGEYNARVYHQRCKVCKDLGYPILNESYAERVVYRLKKWSGIYVEQPRYSTGSKKPHNRSLCEGCKDGHCSDLRDDWIENEQNSYVGRLF
ncbi:hypothetical protein PISL3812_02873 [Talaromyces islandicus]|uniref:3CxxC-type domain-containing protein n=1 Tax=Talaromyces islandicus TaxID=28573 RepID=A0A0U1LTF0_TALIS|nr:hypothetical protein PISL3812_02873 [Talaromyces islandicus]